MMDLSFWLGVEGSAIWQDYLLEEAKRVAEQMRRLREDVDE